MKRVLLRSVVLGIIALAIVLLWPGPRAHPAAPPAAVSPTSMSSNLAATATAPAPAAVASAAAADSFIAKLEAFRVQLGASPSPDDTMRALSALASTDAALAIELAHALGSTPEEKSAWVTDLAKAWTQRAPQAAWDWLSGLEQTRIRNLATGTLPEVIIGSFAQMRPELLLRNLDTLVRNGETPLGVAPVVAVHLGLEALVDHQQLDLARRTVERWATDPAQPAIGEAAFVTVAAGLARSDPERAGAWLVTMPPTAERDIALIEFPAQWAQQHGPRAALDWAANKLPAELRGPALQRTFSDWVESKPADAGEWLGQHLTRSAPGADTDRLIGTLVNLGASVKASPATALQWTRLVSDPATRSALEERVALRWARHDRDAAAGFVASHPGFAPVRKQALLQQLHSPAPLAEQ